MPFIDYQPPTDAKPCQHPRHNPPGMVVLPEGVHSYQCPGCGTVQEIRVSGPTLEGK